MLNAFIERAHELFDRIRLIALGTVVADQFEIHRFDLGNTFGSLRRHHDGVVGNELHDGKVYKEGLSVSNQDEKAVAQKNSQQSCSFVLLVLDID